MLDFNLGIQFFKGAPLGVFDGLQFFNGTYLATVLQSWFIGLDSLRLKFALVRIL